MQNVPLSRAFLQDIVASRLPRQSVETLEASIQAAPTTYAADVQAEPQTRTELYSMNQVMLKRILSLEGQAPTKISVPGFRGFLGSRGMSTVGRAVTCRAMAGQGIGVAQSSCLVGGRAHRRVGASDNE